MARLRAAGAIVVGKTNTPEWGMRPVTEPERYGPARNPWDPELITGGSSGGSAAAVAAGMVPIAHGNDAGGSIRIPASCCGVVGLKPTRFRVPLGPELAAFEGFGVDGVLTRTRARHRARARRARRGGAVDAARAAAPAPVVRRGRGASRRTRCGSGSARPRRAASRSSPECVAAAHHAAGLLVSLGHEVDEWAPDWEDPEFAGHWMRAGAAMFQALIARFGELAGHALDPELMEPPARQALAAPRHAGGAPTRRPRA